MLRRYVCAMQAPQRCSTGTRLMDTTSDESGVDISSFISAELESGTCWPWTSRAEIADWIQRRAFCAW